MRMAEPAGIRGSRDAAGGTPRTATLRVSARRRDKLRMALNYIVGARGYFAIFDARVATLRAYVWAQLYASSAS